MTSEDIVHERTIHRALKKKVEKYGEREFFYFKDIPPKVSISEAIEIAKVFSTEESSSFVNGILDAILNDALSAGKMSMI